MKKGCINDPCCEASHCFFAFMYIYKKRKSNVTLGMTHELFFLSFSSLLCKINKSLKWWPEITALRQLLILCNKRLTVARWSGRGESSAVGGWSWGMSTHLGSTVSRVGADRWKERENTEKRGYVSGLYQWVRLSFHLSTKWNILGRTELKRPSYMQSIIGVSPSMNSIQSWISTMFWVPRQVLRG